MLLLHCLHDRILSFKTYDMTSGATGVLPPKQLRHLPIPSNGRAIGYMLTKKARVYMALQYLELT